MTAKWLCLTATALLLAGCTAEIPGKGDAPTGSGNLPGVGGTSGSTPDTVPVGAAPLAPARLRRLTSVEYENTIHDLLGADVALSEPLESIDRQGFGFTTIGSASVGLSEKAQESTFNGALGLAHGVFADSAKRVALLGCTPAAASDACATGFLRSFARKALRGSLAEAELAPYLKILTDGAALGDVWTGLEYATGALLASPRFLWRSELGASEPGRTGFVRYTPLEMASRLSFLLWGTTPDEQLLSKAESGGLATADEVRGEAARLLGSSRAQAAVLRFFDENFTLDLLDTLAKDTATYPSFTSALGPAMHQELQQVLRGRIFDSPGNFLDLLTSAGTFPADQHRAGLLSMPGILAVGAHAVISSPTRRGKFIREQILCQTIPPPPPTADVMGFQAPDVDLHQTARQKLEKHRVEPTCSGCHALLDPIGLTFEHFDAVGQYRADDKGLPIDTTGSLDGTAFDGPEGLAQALRSNPAVASCLVSQLYRYSTARDLADGDVAQVEALTPAFAGGGNITSLLTALVASDGFRFAGESL